MEVKEEGPTGSLTQEEILAQGEEQEILMQGEEREILMQGENQENLKCNEQQEIPESFGEEDDPENFKEEKSENSPEKTRHIKEDIYSWETVMFLYNAALKKVRTKMDILNDEFGHIHNYNPIEYIKSRIKTPESIVKKLRRDGYDSTIENMLKYVNDIAGVRVVCSFTSDIYKIADMIRKQKDLTIISVKDYFSHPKDNGYKSYHMLVTIPIYMSTGVVDTKVEIQIRTIAMDFWASLEHKIYYKFEGNAPAYIYDDLRSCAEIVSNLDAKMLQLNEAIIRANEPKPTYGEVYSEESTVTSSIAAVSEEAVVNTGIAAVSEELAADKEKNDLTL